MVDYCITNKKEEVVWITTNIACYLPLYDTEYRIKQYHKDLKKHHYYANLNNILRISVPKMVGITLEILEKLCKEFSKNDLKMYVKEGVDHKNNNVFLLFIPFKKYKSINHLKYATHLTRALIEGYVPDNCLFKALEYKDKYPKSNFLRNLLWMTNLYSTGGHNYLTLNSFNYGLDYDLAFPKKVKEIKEIINKDKQVSNIDGNSFRFFSQNSRIIHKTKEKPNPNYLLNNNYDEAFRKQKNIHR